MVMTQEQWQTRFLAIVLPALTLCTHTLLIISFALPISEEPTSWSLIYNILAAGASVFGLVGAVKLIPALVSAYTLAHATTLSFVTLALVNIILPFDTGFLNPVIPSWHVDEDAICRDIDAGFGWDETWFMQCTSNFYTVLSIVAWTGLFLMVAQWWALLTVRIWGKELGDMNLRDGSDIEKLGLLEKRNEMMVDEKMRL